MENIIKELIQIESEADTLVTEADDEMKHLDERMRDKETEIRHSIDQRTTERIDKLYEDARQESFRKIAEIKQKSKESIAALMELYKQNRSRWESDIVNQIIGQ